MEYNKILKKIHSNEVAIGLNLALNSPHLIEFFEVANVDHFDELNILENPQSTFFKKTISLIKNNSERNILW